MQVLRQAADRPAGEGRAIRSLCAERQQQHPLIDSVWDVDSTFVYNGKKLPVKTQNGTTVSPSPMTMDTGSSLIYLPTTAFNAYLNATGAVYNATADFYVVPNNKLSQLRDFEIRLNGGKTVLTLPPSSQLYPPKLGATYVDPSMGQVSIFYDAGAVYGPEFQQFAIGGFALHERFYVSYDADGSGAPGAGTVSFAETKVRALSTAHWGV